MHHRAISAKTVSGPTCNRIEHRALNLTTSSRAFRTPTAHIIFVPSKGASGDSVCIICNVVVPSVAQEFHLSGKRHARNMKRTRGPQACACSALVAARAPQPKIFVMKNRSKGPRIINERRNRSRRDNPRHKRKRCGQRSYVANFMKLGRAGLFPKYVRDSQYHVRPFETWVKPPEIRAACLSSLQRFYSPPKTTPLLLDGIRLTERFFASLGSTGARKCVIWRNALPYIGRFITHALSLSPYLSLGIPPLRRNRPPLDALAAPPATIAKKKEKEPAKKGVPKASAQKTGAQPLSKAKPTPRTKKQPQQQWYCKACDMGMLASSMETHLRGKRHARNAGLPLPTKLSVLRKQGPKGVRSVRPRGGAPSIVVR